MKDWLSDLARNVKEDFEGRAQWVQAREHYFSRRYCLEWRNPTFPWPGSSNIVLPLIDKKIDELKPQYVNLIAAAKPPVTAQAVLPQFQKKAKNVELLFDWLVHHGSPNFIEETILSVDDCLETGRAILKSYWRYESRQTPTIITSKRLPKRLKSLIVSQLDEKHADTLFMAGGGPGGAVVLTKKEFDRMRDGIKAVVLQEFDLDEDEPRDQKAISEILAWLRAGARGELKYESRDVVLNVPAIAAINPVDFVVPENATMDIEDHERICEVMYFTKSQLQALALDQKLDKKALDHLLDKTKKGAGPGYEQSSGRLNWQRNLIDIQQSNREGIDAGGEKDGIFEIWKISTRMSTHEGGPEKKVVALVPADAPGVPLKLKAWNRPSGLWGYHTYTFEMNKRRWYSPRGVPEKLDDLEAEMTAQHRAKLNRAAIVNAPTFKYKPNRHINPNVWKWIPGQMMPTNDPMGDVIPIEMSNLDVAFDNEIQQLRVWAESYLGGPDYGLTDNSTLSEARTATEIQAIQGQARQSLSMRGLLMKLCYNQVWRQFFDMWHTLGPDEVYIRVTGDDEPIRVTKEELQGQFLLQCSGTIGSSDPQVEAQKAQNRLALLAQIQSAGLLGDQYELNMGEAIRDWLEKDDIRLAKLVLRERSQEEIQQIQQQRQQAAAQMQQQELALAAAGSKPSSNGTSKSQGPQQRPGVASLPALGGRN